MKFRSMFAGVVAAMALSACSHVSTLQPAQSFSQQLGKQYTALSVNDGRSSYNWDRSQYFAKKGERAKARIDVQPEDPASWNVPREYRPELNNAYDMLQIALVPDKKKVYKPLPAADAQAYFDCWVEQAHKRWVPTSRENDCRANFYEAFCRMYNGKCSSAIDSDHIFRLYFGLNESQVKGKDQNVITKAAATFKKSGKEIIVAGHSDRVGNPAANLKLSKARAEGVRARLIAAGVPAYKITVKYFGEQLPLIATRDNTPNANNRRVLIVVR